MHTPTNEVLITNQKQGQ